MVKKITNYSVLILICISLSLLLFQAPVSKLFSYFNIQVLDSVAYAQTTYRIFTVTPVTDTTVNSTNPGAAIDDAGYVYVTYEEGTSYVDFKLSTNNGTSFGTAAHVGTGLGRYPRVAIDNVQEAYVVYTHLEGSNYFPRGFKSIHPGSIYTFSKILDATTTGLQGAKSPCYCDIAVENVGGTDNVFVVFGDNDTDAQEDWNIYFIGSNDSGTTWANPAVATIDDLTKDDRYPVIAVKKSEEAHAYVAWVCITDSDIMFDYYTGVWAGNIQISDAAAVVEGQRPGLAASVKSSVTYLAALWCDSRNGNKDVYYDYAVDGGATWHTDVKIGNSSYAAYEQDQPSIAVAPGGNHLYAVWRDSRDGTNHIYFQEATYIDAATGFRWGIDDNADGTVSASEAGDDLRVSSSASGSEETPTVLASAIGKVYVIWRDTGVGIRCGMYNSSTTPAPDPSPIAGTPAAPTGLVAYGYNSRVELDWLDNSESDFSYYKVYRSTTRGTWSCIRQGSCLHHSTSQYADVPLASISASIPAHPVTNSTAYWYVVTAVDTEGKESAYSNDARATPNGEDVTAPNAPTGLAVTAGNTQIALAWTASTSTDVSSYHIYRSNVSGCSFYYVDSTSSPVASYLNSSLANGTKYYYVVTALDSSNNESADSNEANATTTGSYTPGGGTAPDPAPDGGGGGPGGGCFIATASYGSPFAEEVRVLSRFRDTHLTTNIFGRAFVRAYYNLSPPAAKFISGNPVLKFMVRLYLKPLVKLAELVVG